LERRPALRNGASRREKFISLTRFSIAFSIALAVTVFEQRIYFCCTSDWPYSGVHACTMHMLMVFAAPPGSKKWRVQKTKIHRSYMLFYRFLYRARCYFV
jgi:hypothetical protein